MRLVGTPENQKFEHKYKIGRLLPNQPSLAWISVMLSPFSIILPKVFSVFLFRWTSQASSKTRFMYSSKPVMCPSIRVLTFSYSQTLTRVRFWRSPEDQVDGLDHHLLHLLTAA